MPHTYKQIAEIIRIFKPIIKRIKPSGEHSDVNVLREKLAAELKKENQDEKR